MKHWITLVALLALVGCEPQDGANEPAGTAPPAAPAETDEAGEMPEEGAATPAADDGAAVDANSALQTVSYTAGEAAGDGSVVELKAPGMHCEMCAASVVKALDGKPGVVEVKADPSTKLVSLTVDRSQFDRDAAIEAINETGFGEDSDEG
ncbi:heavy-metal-associated domain-containing protein [Botrimarina sp.]|uniref:heavy-metal-associated domain-containing protein n=1 Tax=Botrimarina sp. TaxID=2795802 RepID=UPI0032EBEE99